MKPITMLSLLLSVCLLVSCNQSEPIPEESVRPISWIRVAPTDFQQVRSLSGVIEPSESTDLSFEVGGKVEKVVAKLGDTIKKGQIMAQLDKRTYNLSLQSAEASLQQAQSTFVEAENEFSRYQELVTKGLVSQSGFDNVKTAYEKAVGAVNVAQAKLEIARKDLADTDLLAPYDGQVTKRLAEPSLQVGPGQAIFQIEGQDGLEVKVMVPETLIARIDKAKSLQIRFPVLPGASSVGNISEIGSRAETANAFPVTVFIDNAPSTLRAGMTAEVDFVFEGEGRDGYRGPTFQLPIAAIVAGTNQDAYVFVYDEDKQVVNRREVKIENILNNQLQISSGLEAGEIVATAGVNFLKDGQRVNLLDKHVQQFN